MFDWLEDTNLYFLFQKQEVAGSGVAVQMLLTVLAALLGAGAAAYLNWRATETTRKAKLHSLALSTMYKISRSASIMRGVKRSFFGNVDQNTPARDYWTVVRPGIPMFEGDWGLTNEEFEFLLGEQEEDQFAYSVLELLEFTQINIRSMNEYSAQRRALSAALDPHTEQITEADGTVTTAINLDQHPAIARMMLETSDLCALVLQNVDEAIEMSQAVVQQANTRIPPLTENPKFNKRLNIGE